MAITKPEYWLVSIGLILILSISLLSFGNSLKSNSSATLDEDSLNYLSNYESRLINNSFKEEGDSNLASKDVNNPFLKRLGQIPIINDVFAGITFFTNALNGVWDFFALSFNLPSFFFESLGIPIEPVRFIINIFGTVLFLGFLIAMLRLIK
jgi:hypothetical protein